MPEFGTKEAVVYIIYYITTTMYNKPQRCLLGTGGLVRAS